MPLQGLGWARLGIDQDKSLQLHGKKLVRSYSAESFADEPSLEWFRTMIDDVERSMGLRDFVVGVTRIALYEKLELSPVRNIIGKLGNFFSKRKSARSVRGAVMIGEHPTLYLTEEGLQIPRIVYEEVAHSLVRPLDAQHSDLRPKQFERHIRDMLIRGPENRVIRWWIECHLDIFRGFMSNSVAMQMSPNKDVEDVRRMINTLERSECRRQSASQDRCKC